MTRRVINWLALAVLIVVSLRFVIVVSRAESGWDFVATEWQNALLAPIGLGHTPIGDAPPSEQVDFWLREVDRVVDENPESASLAMGGAWMLDSPGMGYLQHSTVKSPLAPLTPRFGPSFDRQVIAKEKATFQRKAATELRYLAKQATDLEPADVRWWRMRALLLFEADILFSGREFGARTFDWLEVLDECKQHDPENALYDYLAALELWKTSAKYAYPPYQQWDPDDAETADEPPAEEEESTIADEDRWILTIEDPERFGLGLDRFEAAQQLPTMAIGEAGNSSIADFLNQTSLRTQDQAEIAKSRLLTFRLLYVFAELWRWQEAQADDAYHRSDPAQMILVRQRLRMFDQAIAPQETSALEVLAKFSQLRQYAVEEVEALAKSEPGLISPEELSELRQREETLRVDATLLIEGLTAKEAASARDNELLSWAAKVSMVSAGLVASLLVVAAACLIVGTLLSRKQDAAPQFGAVRHLIAWTVGCGLSFVILGMAPAEIIPPAAQHMIISATLWFAVATAVAMAIVHIVRYRRKHPPRFRLLTLLVVTTGCAMVAAAWAYVAPAIERFVHDPPEVVIPAKGWSGMEAEVLRVGANVAPQSWEWAAIQWILYHGPYVALALSLALIVAWSMWRWARHSHEGLIRYWSHNIRSRWAYLAYFLAKSAAVAVLGWLFVYFCAAPTSIQYAERTFQDQMRYYRDLPAHLADIESASLAVRNNASEFNRIREEVRFEMSRDEVMAEELPKN